MHVRTGVLLAFALAACSRGTSSPPSDVPQDETAPTDEAPANEPTDEEPAVAESLTVTQYFAKVHGLSLSNVLWGDMHTHSFYSLDAYTQTLLDPDATPVTPSLVYERARQRHFSFSSVTDHAEAPTISQIPDDAPNVWASTLQMAAAATDAIADENGVFFPFVGFEYTNPYPCTDDTPGDGINECGDEEHVTCTSLGGVESCDGHGHKNVVFRSLESAPTERASFLDPSSWTASGDSCEGDEPDNYCGFDTYTTWAFTNPDLWSWLASVAPTVGSAISIIHTPGNIHHVDWNVIDERYVRNVEIYSQWGNSEGPPPDACVGEDDVEVNLPAGRLNREEDLVRPQLAQRWLIEGDVHYALSFVGGSDDHSGNPGGDGNGNGGVTGVLTTDATADGIFAGIYNRHTIASTYYSSTGPLPLLFSIATGGASYLGGDLGPIGNDGVVTVRILAPDTVEQVQIVVDGCTVATLTGHVHELTLPSLSANERHYIYVRARIATTAADNVDEDTTVATDFNQTWSSPVYLQAAGL